MKRVMKILATGILIAVASAAWAQSLGDLADKEKARRREVRQDRVISEDEANKYRSQREAARVESDKTTAPSEKPDGKTPETSSPAAKGSGDDESVDFQGRPESYWRKTMSEARLNVKNLENESNVLVLRLSSLQDQFYKEADGFRRETIQREIQKTYYEQDLNKENLEKAKTALRDLENEGRKSGALPGWIEGRNQ